jgi:hypothetical protein
VPVDFRYRVEQGLAAVRLVRWLGRWLGHGDILPDGDALLAGSRWVG